MSTSILRFTIGIGLILLGLIGWYLTNYSVLPNWQNLITDLCTSTIGAGIVFICVDYIIEKRQDQRDRRLCAIAMHEIMHAIYPLSGLICNIVKATTPYDVPLNATWEDVLSEASATRSMHLDTLHDAPMYYAPYKSTPWYKHIYLISSDTLTNIADLKRSYWQVLSEDVTESIDSLTEVPLLMVWVKLNLLEYIQEQADYGKPCMLRLDETIESFKMIENIFTVLEKKAIYLKVKFPSALVLINQDDVSPGRGDAIRVETPYIPSDANYNSPGIK